MKLWDRIKLSIKTLRGRWTVLPIIAVVLASFCICYAGAIFTAVKEEKEQPHELVLTPDSNVPVTDSSIIEISDLQGVVAVSPLYFIPVVMETGVYSAQLTLTGIDSNYIAEPFIEGTIYPESSTMPYVVLNEASLMEFSDANSNTSGNKKAPDIDWLNAGFSIEIPGIRKIVSKVCGILSSDAASNGEDQTGSLKNIDSSQQPNAYISLSTAKDLLQRSGQSTEYSAAYVRVTNIGQADKISREVASLGLFTSNSSEELQTKWDALTREMYYLIIMDGVEAKEFQAGILLTRFYDINSRLGNRKHYCKSPAFISFTGNRNHYYLDIYSANTPGSYCCFLLALHCYGAGICGA